MAPTISPSPIAPTATAVEPTPTQPAPTATAAPASPEPLLPSATPVPAEAAAATAPPPAATTVPSAAPVVASVPVRLTIPDLKIDVPVVEMGWRVVQTADGPRSDWVIPKNEAGHHINSALLGEEDNLVISGHNNIYGEVFKPISFAWDNATRIPVDSVTDRSDLLNGRTIELFDAAGQEFKYTIAAFYRLKDTGVSADQRIANGRFMEPTDQGAGNAHHLLAADQQHAPAGRCRRACHKLRGADEPQPPPRRVSPDHAGAVRRHTDGSARLGNLQPGAAWPGVHGSNNDAIKGMVAGTNNSRSTD